MKKRIGIVVATLMASLAQAALPDVAQIALSGSYSGHLQDVWFDGTYLYWAHTADILRTDLEGNVLARVTISDNHHAGLEVRNGRLYTAICPMAYMSVIGGTNDTKVVVGEYDAETLQLITNHVTAVNDRAGSLSMLPDGSFLVGCLRQADMGVDEVRYHHFDADFNLIQSYRIPEVPVKMGIEVLKARGPFRYLCVYGCDAAGKSLTFNTVKVDPSGQEVWRGTIGGDRGLVVDGDDLWVGDSSYDSTAKVWTSKLVRKANTLPTSISAVPHLVRGRVQTCDVYFDAAATPRVLYAQQGNEKGWTRLVRIADIPAGATAACGIGVPRTGVTRLRFFLDDQPLAVLKDALSTPILAVRADDSSAYVADGLIAQWDGRDNAGRGVHNAAAAYPVELVSGLAQTLTGTIPAAADSFTLGSGDLAFDSQTIIDACNAGAATVEVLMAPDGDTCHNGGIVAFGNTSRAFWIYERKADTRTHLIGDSTYHGAIAGDFQALNVDAATAGTNLYSFVMGTGTESILHTDGLQGISLTRFATNCTDTVCRIGSLGGKWTGTRARAKVFSIRVYNRLLTAAERRHNLAIDRMRFLAPEEIVTEEPTLVLVR